ncbi:peroxiredoxin family protein [Planctomycetota bacterium]
MALAKNHRKAGLQVIRVISGDNELSALDFQKHYRMPVIHLIDSDVACEMKYGKGNWPFLMLVDSEGKIVYQCSNMIERDRKLMRLLNKLKDAPNSAATMTADGVYYMTSTLQRSGEVEKLLQNERFTSIAAGDNGQIYTVFTSLKNGKSDIVMRIFDGSSSSKDISVAATQADEYDSTVLLDNMNQVWVCWTSNAVDSKYQIHLTSLKDIRDGRESINVSKSKDDAMHGRMTSDDSGVLWITYYQWHNMGQNSRDKEVYLRKYSNGAFSKEIHISPTDVSSYEDHTDPSISIMNEQVFVSWSWDFHRPKGYTKDAKEPTIFARTINQDFTLGKPFHISGHRIDATPMLSSAYNDNLWCAWDSLGWSQKEQVYRKTLYVRSLNAHDAIGKEFAVAEDLVNVCSPCFAFDSGRKGVLTWSQSENGKDWTLWKAEYDPDNNCWKEPAMVISEENPRFGSCVYDTQGRLWIAYSVRTDKGREVFVKRVD